MQTNSTIKLVIFDLWQTLVDIRCRPLEEIHRLSRVDVSFKQFVEDFKKSDLFLVDDHVEILLGKFFEQYTSFSNLEQCVGRWKNIASEAYLYEETMNLVTSLKADYRLAMCTNVDKFGYENFLFQNLFGHFDYIFASYQHGFKKPDTRCWEVISNHFPDVSYSEMLMVGDSEADDIVPAASLGINTFHVSESRGLKTLKKRMESTKNNPMPRLTIFDA